MIFGGMIEPEEGEEQEDTLQDNGQIVRLSDQSYYLDVTKGSIKRGPNLVTPSYYINNGGNMLCIANKLYAQGFGINFDLKKGSLSSLSALSSQDQKTSLNESSRDANSSYHHKKILHCYN